MRYLYKVQTTDAAVVPLLLLYYIMITEALVLLYYLHAPDSSITSMLNTNCT
jgi:hypothetical protein